MLSGPGAGQMPTTAAVVGDLMNLSDALRLQDATDFFQLEIQNSWARVTPPAQWVSPFLIRFTVKDQPESASAVGTILEKHKIGISSIHENVDVGIKAFTGSADPTATVVVITHEVQQAEMNRALSELALSPFVLQTINCLPILENSLIK
jgi:hypothetical protein